MITLDAVKKRITDAECEPDARKAVASLTEALWYLVLVLESLQNERAAQ